MAKSHLRAQLIERLSPGLSVILFGLIAYFFVRFVAPASESVRVLIFVFSNLFGLGMMAFSVVAWLKGAHTGGVEEDLEMRDSFISNMRKAAALPITPEGEEFCARAEANRSVHSVIRDGECWAYDLKTAVDSPYRVRGYFAFNAGRIGMAVAYGLPGCWHRSFFLVADYELEGSVLTLKHAFGDLRSWGERGTRLIFLRGEGTVPTIEMEAAMVGELFETELPEVLRPHLA